MNVKPLFKLMVEKKASDLFFAPFSPAKIKIEGKIMPVNKLEMTPKMVKQAAFELMTEDQMDEFNRELEIDFALSEQGLGRCRYCPSEWSRQSPTQRGCETCVSRFRYASESWVGMRHTRGWCWRA